MDLDYRFTKKRKKGIQQRQQEEEQENIYKSVLAEFLLQEMAWGIFSTLQVEKIAAYAQQDLFAAGVPKSSFPDLDELAKAGTYGKHANNVHRDIMRSVESQTEYKPYDCWLPFKDFGEQQTKMNLPHEVFSHLYTDQPEAFKAQMLPRPAQLPIFWRTVQSHPAMSELSEEDLNKAIPLGLHGDEVPITGVGKVWCKAALTFQFFSILCHACATPTKELMHWIWAVFEKLCLPGENGTVYTCMKVLKWSFQALKRGKWPTHDWYGIQ